MHTLHWYSVFCACDNHASYFIPAVYDSQNADRTLHRRWAKRCWYCWTWNWECCTCGHVTFGSILGMFTQKFSGTALLFAGSFIVPGNEEHYTSLQVMWTSVNYLSFWYISRNLDILLRSRIFDWSLGTKINSAQEVTFNRKCREYAFYFRLPKKIF